MSSLTLEQKVDKIIAYLTKGFGFKLEGSEVPKPEPKPEPGPTPTSTVKADQKGIEGDNVFKIAGVQGDGADPGLAIDGKKSTSYEGRYFQANLGGIGAVRAVGLKFEGGPYNFKFATSNDGNTWTDIVLGSLTSGIETPEFTHFIFPEAVKCAHIKLESTENKLMKIRTIELLDADPDPAGEPVPDQPPIEIPAAEPGVIPVPQGFKAIGKIFLQTFKHWGRHETGYASGGSGPSERWDCKDLPKTLNILAGYEFNLGTKHGKRGDDNIDLKARGPDHSDGNCGWYISYIEWLVSGGDAGAGVGKECPHPKTDHHDFNVQGKGTKVKNILDGKWHGFLTSTFNDEKGNPTTMLWYNENATGKIADYKLLGISKDTGNMTPGKVIKEISKSQSLQIRADEVPDCKIRNAFAVEVEPPKN